jgi:N-acetyltransferase 10
MSPVAIVVVGADPEISFSVRHGQDVHARFRTESHGDVVGRFNERFILSLAACKSCLVMDDELNPLPLSSHTKYITPLPNLEVHAASSDLY